MSFISFIIIALQIATALCFGDTGCDTESTPDYIRPGCESTVAKNHTSAAYVGGSLYITEKNNRGSWSEVVDLADAAIAAGCVPKYKPHMVIPSPDGTHVAVSYTADTFIHVIDAETKDIVMCVDASNPTPGVEGASIHTGAWFGDDAFIMVDMTGSINGVSGGALHKFAFDWSMSIFSYEGSVGLGATVAEARGTSGTKPIAIGTNPFGEFSHLYYVTDAVGSGSVLNATSMTFVGHLNVNDFGDCAAGGLWVESHPYNVDTVVAQYGSQTGGDCLFAINLNEVAISRTFSLPEGSDDAHGLQYCTRATDSKLFMINTNRVSKTLDVIDYDTGDFLVEAWSMNENLPGYDGNDRVQPDVIAYDDESGMLYIAARGPSPVSAVKAYNFLETATPGLFMLQLTDCAAPAYPTEDYFLSTDWALVTSDQTSDVHGAGIVNDEVWAIDQAATGSVQTYAVYSKCPAY